MKKIKYILLLVISSVLLSCQMDNPIEEKSDKSKPSTFANFYVRFLQNENQTEATAAFQNGMNQQIAKPLKIDKGVFFHNGNMVERTISKFGTRYQASYDGPFSEIYKFQFNDPLKGKTDHFAQMNSFLNYSFEGEVSKSKGATLTWEGNALNENESLVFIIKNSNNQALSFELNEKTNEPRINIAPKNFSNLELGTKKIYLVRKHSYVEQKPNLVILTDTEFYTIEKDITIVP